jgi:hypothetical protein
MLCTEFWALDCEEFDGGWILNDCGDSAYSAQPICLARLVVVGVAAHAIRRQRRGEDLRDDVAGARAYLAELDLTATTRRGLLRVLDALTPFDPARLAEELLNQCAVAGRAGLDGSARSLAELAYDAALAFELNAAAQGAALALARLATLQECPGAARKWQALGHTHGRQCALARAP